MHDQYIFSGSLPENASTYVKREADDELYEALLQNKFCYVLNSRQSGKSSLRVRTMSRLSEAGVECASIDLSSINIQSATEENWYADLIVKLIDSFALDVDFKDWWEENQLNSPLLKFGDFLSKMLLTEISENIVIFIDEIDSVLSLNFKTDDFFTFIRSCYNQRVDNPEYNRLTFCLLGVASPSNLIEDKQRTPFNIGKAISLKGFQIHEAEPLVRGLEGIFPNPQAVMKEILYWTGGQPFLTQKLCQFMVEESLQDNPCSVEEVVRSRIIENWESLDEPEHLRTIRARILRDEERAGYLLELYQQVRLAEEQSEITADDTLEQSELQLSGLVVKQENKLRVYNAIYQEIFDQNWIEIQLKNLRPYSENFRFWVASGQTDDSRLLRGKALQEAEEWAKDKNNLSYQDKQYLAASKQKEIQEEIAVKEQEAALERERKDKEATETRNQVLSEANQALADANQALGEANKMLADANQKARRRISIGSVALLLTLVGAAISVTWAGTKLQEIGEKTKYLSDLYELSKLSERLVKSDKLSAANQARQKIGLSYAIENHELKKAMIFTSMSQAYQQLNEWDQAEKKITESQNILEANKDNITSSEGLQIQVLSQKIQGDLLVEKKETQKAIEAYKAAFNILKSLSTQTSPNNSSQIITAKNIESVHRSLIELLSNNNTELDLKTQVEQSLTEYLYVQLSSYLKVKNLQQADRLTYQLMLNIAKREKEGYLDYDQINTFSCPALRRIDKLWFNSDNRFGFRVQKEIWIKTGNRLGIKLEQWNDKDKENYYRFAKAVGWYDDKVKNKTTGYRGQYVEYDKLIEGIKSHPDKYRGSLPNGNDTLLYGSQWTNDTFDNDTWHKDYKYQSFLESVREARYLSRFEAMVIRDMNFKRIHLSRTFLYFFFSRTATCKV
ncbi:AAA-like domain-containing protein [Aetokthonos hydrillicola Thurmond2011]|jgi:hypothetical protein|uniref:AAA-like domain-containing protein n=1 Tax=Aetokthonos hydrillicola Thurmond2011 TaxID=2712845 RepID=A0AAP5IEI6_9CYAN|nr:AAA-like domain-containing protein [Aetokthonos hydrillicola]MBO3461221.1 hypothetical protein [Aetokthonos hydrillicola CCALA 1050]MBW4591050.1 AAA-like domain-containing protein [Aetokthonos hydrillicola CCALA 1050]MDR9900220.1 AAA-like domain-containing protein [Aetokthonos hydrillicola Thurmond2011]